MNNKIITFGLFIGLLCMGALLLYAAEDSVKLATPNASPEAVKLLQYH